jgi:molybdopterin converting factor small subunit
MALVKVYANLRTIIGKKELSIPGLSIQEVLGKLIQDYPGLKPFLLEEGKLRPRVIITRNGQTLEPACKPPSPIRTRLPSFRLLQAAENKEHHHDRLGRKNIGY